MEDAQGKGESKKAKIIVRILGLLPQIHIDFYL